MFDLSGKKVLISGGAQNFGLEIASGMLEAGADVIITSRNLKKAESCAAELAGKYPGTVTGMQLDLLSEQSIIKLFDDINKHYDRLDVLVNNAGGHDAGATGKLETEPLESWQIYIDLNLTGAFLMIREYAKLMMKQKSGSIINIASIAAAVGRDRNVYKNMKGQSVQYAAAKAGLLGLTYDTAAYLGPFGIRVNAISPGGFERDNIPEVFVKEYSKKTMLGRMGKDGFDLKGATVFLASDEAGYITAQNLFIDGGFVKFK